MGVDFRLRDFAYPLSLMRLKRCFDRNQWLDAAGLEQYQVSRLQAVFRAVGERVPYLRRILSSAMISPGGSFCLSDLRRLPLLTKAALRKSRVDFTADNLSALGARKAYTSGTGGVPLEFYLDKASNILEFVYYWRFWGWFGYRLGAPFAELSAEYFLRRRRLIASVHDYQRPFGRLLFNALRLSPQSAPLMAELLRRHRIRYLKGLPSNVFLLTLFCREQDVALPRLRAVFTQGEALLPMHRRVIEEAFSAPVFESYGQMERVAAISQCPRGAYHVHADYGLVEFVENEASRGVACAPDEYAAEIVGTSLYNLAMPLVRYATGDLAILKREPARCPCGRGFPMVRAVIGRSTDAVLTPDGRAVTAVYTAFEGIPGLLMAQVLQEELCRLRVRCAVEPGREAEVRAALEIALRRFVGEEMGLDFQFVAPDELRSGGSGKMQSVVSFVSRERFAATGR